MSKQVNPALARKLSVIHDSVDEASRPILRALRLGLARAAGEGIGLPLSVIGVKHTRRVQDDLAAVVQDGWLMLLLSAAENHVAAVCLDPSCVSAIVQQQTISTVLNAPPQPRPFTDTDAAMVAPLIENMLERALNLVEAPSDQASLSGMEFVARPENMRALTLALVADAYRVFDLTFELAGGVRQGQLCVMLPERPEDHEDEADGVAAMRLEQATGMIRADLNAVISRLPLPFATLTGLKAGDVLPLPNARLDGIEVLAIDRSCASVGRLGQCRGWRAVRVNELASLTPLPEPEQAGFMASKPSRPLPEKTVQAIAEPASDGPKDGIAASDAPHDVVLADKPENMLAEITQLAGLNGPEHAD